MQVTEVRDFDARLSHACAHHSSDIWIVRKEGYKVILLNSNPVSTDRMTWRPLPL